MNNQKKVFYTPSNGDILPLIIDMAILNQQGSYVGQYSKEPLELVAKRYPGVLMGDFQLVSDSIHAAMKSMPSEITEAKFNEYLGALPPEDWQSSGNEESFKICEYLSGSITTICAKTHGRFYAFNDVATLTHAEIIQKIQASEVSVSS